MPSKVSYLEDQQRAELMENISGSPVDMALKLMDAGLNMNQIPIDDPEALQRMYDLVINNTSSSNRLAYVINSLDIKGHVDLSDKLEKLAFSPEFSDYDLEVNPFAGEPMTPQDSQLQQQQMLEPDPSLEDEELEDEVSIKDIDSLIGKLEAVMDAMGDDFDPDLLPIAKKIISQLNEKLDKIDTSEAETTEPQTTPEAEPQAPVEQPALEQTPAVANIIGATIRLAQKSEIFDDTHFLETSQAIDEILLDIDNLVKRIK